MDIRRLPASAGADWLLEAFRLFMKSPMGFAVLGVIYAGLTLAVMAGAQISPAMGGVLQLVFLLLGPLLMAGMIFAAHEVDAGRSAMPGHLMAAIRTGRAGRVLTTLIPQIAIAALVIGLLYLLVGHENMLKISELVAKIQAQAQTGTQVDPNLLMQLPAGRLFAWMVLTMGILLVTLFLTFTVVPDLMFADVRLVAAMKRSLRACLGNLPAMLVFMALALVVLFAVGIGLGIVMGILQLVLGPAGAMVGNALGNGIMICYVAATMYVAWKQMLGGTDAAPPAAPSSVAM
jgi:hypothetical protein